MPLLFFFSFHFDQFVSPAADTQPGGRLDGQEKPHSRPETLSLDERLIHNLRRCGHYLRHHTEEKGSQRRVLFLLHRRGPMTQKDLPEMMGVRAGFPDGDKEKLNTLLEQLQTTWPE